MDGRLVRTGAGYRRQRRGIKRAVKARTAIKDTVRMMYWILSLQYEREPGSDDE